MLAANRLGVHCGAVDLADGIHPGNKFCSGDLLEELLCNGTGAHASDGLAGGASSATAVVAETVLEVVAEVGMAGPVPLLYIGVVITMLVFVEHDERNRGTGRFPFENAAQDLHLVLFVAGGGHFALSGAPAIQEFLDVLFAKGDACRTAVQHGADGRTV